MIRLLPRLAALSARSRALLAIFAGVLLALGLPPVNLWPLAFLGVPLFLGLIATLKGRGLRRGFGTGWLFGLGYFALAFHWIGFAFLVEAQTYLWMMPFMLGALAGGMAIYWGLAALLLARVKGGPLASAVAFSGLFGAAEWLRGHLFTGFPWAVPGLLADGMGGLAQAASLFGMTGLTVLVLLWAALPLALAEGGARQRAAAAALLLALPGLWLWGDARLAAAGGEVAPAVRFRIVQPNIPQQEKWREDNSRDIFDRLKQLSAMPTPSQPSGIGGVTHVVWPESAVPFLIDESVVARDELRPLLGGRTALITGSIRRSSADAPEPDVFNSIIVFDGAATPVARYDKWRLVPGGEFLPLGWLLEPLGFRKVVETPGSFTAGAGPRTIRLPGGLQAALLVCYEIVFPDRLVDAAQRPQLIVNVTNDGWFGRSTGPWQHLAQARLRAIEQGLPVIRAANTGISAVIDPYGRVLKSLPLMEEGVIDSDLPAAIAPPAYARLGDLGLALLLALAAAGTVLGLRSART